MNTPLPTSDSRQVHQMTQTEGWNIIASLLKGRFTAKLHGLRKSRRDSAFYKAQGYLDAIDEIFNIVGQQLNDIEEGEQ